jgi:hypothetical protein
MNLLDTVDIPIRTYLTADEYAELRTAAQANMRSIANEVRLRIAYAATRDTAGTAAARGAR